MSNPFENVKVSGKLSVFKFQVISIIFQSSFSKML